jgi:hypothetical protein
LMLPAYLSLQPVPDKARQTHAPAPVACEP